MAREFAAIHPNLVANIVQAKRTCNASHSPVAEYLKTYIVKPAYELGHPYKLVVLIDGLDEWSNHETFI